MDRACIKVNGASKYLYRAVDKQGQTVHFLLSAKRESGSSHENQGLQQTFP
jgi:putative transposase